MGKVYHALAETAPTAEDFKSAVSLAGEAETPGRAAQNPAFCWPWRSSAQWNSADSGTCFTIKAGIKAFESYHSDPAAN